MYPSLKKRYLFCILIIIILVIPIKHKTAQSDPKNSFNTKKVEKIEELIILQSVNTLVKATILFINDSNATSESVVAYTAERIENVKDLQLKTELKEKAELRGDYYIFKLYKLLEALNLLNKSVEDIKELIKSKSTDSNTLNAAELIYLFTIQGIFRNVIVSTGNLLLNETKKKMKLGSGKEIEFLALEGGSSSDITRVNLITITLFIPKLSSAGFRGYVNISNYIVPVIFVNTQEDEYSAYYADAFAFEMLHHNLPSIISAGKNFSNIKDYYGQKNIKLSLISGDSAF